MAVLRIVTVQDDDPVLRQVAAPARRVDRSIRALIDDLVETMRVAPGVGLAAPQVGVRLRVIVVETPIDVEDPESELRLLTLIDPEITWSSDEIEEDEEACLSIPDLFGDVPRHVHVRLKAIDRSGRRVELEASDFEARVIQHEIDHLDGILFPDRVTALDKLYTLEQLEDGSLERVPYEVPML